MWYDWFSFVPTHLTTSNPRASELYITSSLLVQWIQYIAPFRLLGFNSSWIPQRETCEARKDTIVVWLVLFCFALFTFLICGFASRTWGRRQTRRSTWGIILAFTVLCSFLYVLCCLYWWRWRVVWSLAVRLGTHSFYIQEAKIVGNEEILWYKYVCLIFCKCECACTFYLCWCPF